jgi:hypothetical protein
MREAKKTKRRVPSFQYDKLDIFRGDGLIVGEGTTGNTSESDQG